MPRLRTVAVAVVVVVMTDVTWDGTSLRISIGWARPRTLASLLVPEGRGSGSPGTAPRYASRSAGPAEDRSPPSWFRRPAALVHAAQRLRVGRRRFAGLW